ncbi:MAG: carotenoid oxygenase family protein [Myxococcota bacterium]
MLAATAGRAERRGPDLAEVVARSYATQHEELTDVPLRLVEGAVPEGLRGVLYRNGPGTLEAHGIRYQHPFDGDGMIRRYAFGPGGEVRYTNRFVATRERHEESRAGRMMYRAFGTNLPGGLRRNGLRMRFKNAANTSLVHHAGLLLALWEGGLPHALDDATLETRGRHDYAGALRAKDPVGRLLSPELPFSAHPSVCPMTGELFNFGTVPGRENTLLVHRVSPSGELTTTRHALPRMPFVHDMALTRRWLVFFLTPVRFDVARALLGLSTPVEAIRQDPGVPTDVLCIPRSGGPPAWLQGPPCFVFHHAGAYDLPDGRVVVCSYRMDGFAGGAVDVQDASQLREWPYPDARLTRYVLDPARLRVTETRLHGRPGELPTTDPRTATEPYRVVWAGVKPEGNRGPVPTALARYDLPPLDAEAGARETFRDFTPDLPGEPLFVPRDPAAREGEGWLLSVMYRAREHRSDLVILDATSLATVARLALPHHVPPGFHGIWVG